MSIFMLGFTLEFFPYLISREFHLSSSVYGLKERKKYLCPCTHSGLGAGSLSHISLSVCLYYSDTAVHLNKVDGRHCVRYILRGRT